MFLAGPTFNLLQDDGTSLLALRRMRAHLEPGGSALVPLFVPEPVPPDEIGRVREASDERGALLRLTTVSSARDDERRLQTTVLRYEVVEPGGTVAVSERPWSLHWHTPAGFRRLAEDAGFEIAAVRGPDGDPVGEDADQFTFLLRIRRR